MNKIKVSLVMITFFAIAGAFVGVASALFSDAAQSTTNTFSAAQVFPTATPSATLTPTATPTPENIATHLVISEVQITGGPGNTDHDFIELYNPTNAPFDLNGFRLIKRIGNSSTDTTIKSWTSSAFVAAHSYYLWASSADSAFPVSIGADISTTQTIAAENSIALRQGAENTGSLIDVLSWNSGSTLVEGTEFSPDPGVNQSMERKAQSTSTGTTMSSGGIDEFKGNGYDTDNNANDFVLRTTSQPQNTSSSTETP